MLAFAFKSFSVEADLARGLLMNDLDADEETKKDEIAAHPISDDCEDSATVPYTAVTMLSMAMSGLARPLKSRITQVVSTLASVQSNDPDESDEDDDDDNDADEESAVLRLKSTNLYEICGLLLFYASTMEKSLEKMIQDQKQNDISPTPQSNPLVESLHQCLTDAATAYEATIRVYAAMLEQWSILTGDSEAELVQQLLVQLAEVKEHSPGFAIEHTENRCLSVEWATETLLELVIPKCTTLDHVVVLQDALKVCKKAGMSLTEGEKLDEQLETAEGALMNNLVQVETEKVLELSGLGGLAQAYERWKCATQSIAMSDYPGLSKSQLETAMKEFYSSLYSPPLPSLEATVKSPAVRKVARSKIAEAVCEVYGNLYRSIAETSSYSDTSFLGHTPEQVKTLFSA
jgi:conserved oligomeric Golgi complex subunit 6